MGKKTSKNRINKKKKNSSNLYFKKGHKVSRRSKDIDQIQEELKTYNPTVNKPIDQDLPGLGQYYCLTCARYFITESTLLTHNTSKVHKKRLKLIAEPQYTQAEADAAAGMAPAI